MDGRYNVGACGLVLALISSHPAKAQVSAPVILSDPSTSFGPANYPIEALRQREQGRVVAKLTIDAAGRVTACTIETSSGSASLDRTTCDIAGARLTFRPATDGKGAPVPSTYALPVRWSLPDPVIDVTRDMMPDLELEVVVTIDTTGKVVACKTLGETALVGPDACAPYPVGSDGGYRWQRNCRPIGGKVRHRYSIAFEYDP